MIYLLKSSMDVTQRRYYTLDSVLEIMHSSTLHRNSITECRLVGSKDSLLVVLQHEKVEDVVLDGLSSLLVRSNKWQEKYHLLHLFKLETRGTKVFS